MVCGRLLLLACLGCLASGCGGAQHTDDETSSADDAPRNTRHRSKKHKHHDDSNDEAAPRKHKTAAAADDDEATPKQKAAKKVADDDDAPKKQKKPHHQADDDDDAPKKPVHRPAAKKLADDDDDAPKKPVHKPAAKKLADDDDDDDAPKKPAHKPAAKKPADDDDDDAPKKPVHKLAAKKPADDEDDDAPKKPVHKLAAKKPADDEDAEVLPNKHAAKPSTDDDDEHAAKPKAVAVKAKQKPKAGDDDAPIAKRPAVKAKAKVVAEPKHDDEPTPEEPPKKQRSIEEDVEIDDPLATTPPPRPVASTDEGDAAGDSATPDAVAVAVAPPPGTQLQDRALTTPEGQIDLHAGLPINVLTLTDPTGASTSSTSEGLALGVAYGVNAKAEVGLDYTLGLSPGAIEGPTTLHGAYSLAHGKLDFAAAAAIAIDFYDTVDSTTMTTSTQTAASLQLGAWVRYHATPTISLFSGLPATPNTSASLSRLAFPLPVLSYQVQIGLSARSATAITLPIGLGYQASPKLYTFANVNLANIRIANTSNAFLFKDYIPVAIGGFYDFDTFSLGASFADDLKQGLGYLRFELTARYLLH
ncbi:MAG: hypothetical protein ABI591_23785 [Kofleriaceae bacterium]